MDKPLQHSPLGVHLIVELYGCLRERLNNSAWLDATLVAAASEAGATVVSSSFHHFSPQGVSGVVIIAESHITIHTWPEIGYAALDVFTCGKPDLTDRIAEKIVERLEAEPVQRNTIQRGVMQHESLLTR